MALGCRGAELQPQALISAWGTAASPQPPRGFCQYLLCSAELLLASAHLKHYIKMASSAFLEGHFFL